MARRPVRTVRHPPWRDEYRAEFFMLAPDDWTPPTHITSTLGATRRRLTLQARFRQPDGTRAVLTTRLVREGEAWAIVERKIDVRMTWKPEVVR